MKIIFYVIFYSTVFRVATWSGNQKKSGKTKKNDNSQIKMGVFKKSQEKVRIFFFLNIIFCQFKFTAFLVYKYLQLVKNLLKIHKSQTKFAKFS